MGSLAAGEHFPSARVTVFKSNSTAKLVTYKLGDVVVSGLEQTARKETVTLQYDRIEMTSGGVSVCREISSNTAC
jgi:type VI protein secretion system component Hcp